MEALDGVARGRIRGMTALDVQGRENTLTLGDWHPDAGQDTWTVVPHQPQVQGA